MSVTPSDNGPRGVDVTTHEVTFKEGRNLFSLVAVCSCGWMTQGQGMQTDSVYWRARAHFAEVSPPRRPQLDTAF